MANTTNKNKLTDRKKLGLSIIVLVLAVILFNPTTYNMIKKQFVKNSSRYIEMIAYSKAQDSFSKKYFIVQENDFAKSFFEGKMDIVSEDELCNITGGDKDIILIYEKQTEKVDKFVKENSGQELILNSGTDIEFRSAKIKRVNETCNVSK